MIYIASPYSHADQSVIDARYDAVLAYTARLLNENECAYSPVVHCHDMANKFEMPKTFDFWQHYNRAMIDRADVLHVLCLEGWEQSKGVTGEIEYAKRRGIPVQHILLAKK